MRLLQPPAAPQVVRRAFGLVPRRRVALDLHLQQQLGAVVVQPRLERFPRTEHRFVRHLYHARLAVRPRHEQPPVHEPLEDRVDRLDRFVVPPDGPARIVAVLGHLCHPEKGEPQGVFLSFSPGSRQHGIRLASDGAVQAALLLVFADGQLSVFAVVAPQLPQREGQERQRVRCLRVFHQAVGEARFQLECPQFCRLFDDPADAFDSHWSE